ncbi:hypothetical protein KP509_07G077700 [Ceratopteris richardii]|uniref:C2H2-type domain-containing protein n=1 Tax=Ceratopteris richardii TaxID=49495 RepID=A0A8T2UBE7_CERRI|nr:hypothetical protein KP509_07G077700 [Ceratopteris richardii]
MACQYSDEESDYYCQPCDRHFVSDKALHDHLSQSSRHFYCVDCKRGFSSENSYRQHRASKLHQQPFVFCPRCRAGFVSASAFTKHVEVGRCYNLTNKQILHCVRELEEKLRCRNMFTIPRLGWRDDYEPGSQSKTYASQASFNGRYYECVICGGEFEQLRSLNQHLNSNVHEPYEYSCKYCGKQFRELSALVAHVEWKACGGMGAERLRNFVRKFGSLSLTNG